MDVFIVEAENSPGRLARLCEEMAARDINLMLAAVAHGRRGTIAFTADREQDARSVLVAMDVEFVARQALRVRIANFPGAGATLFTLLASAGVNVDIVLPLRISDDEFLGAICAEDLIAARNALGASVVD
jgi:hypothetical protein